MNNFIKVARAIFYLSLSIITLATTYLIMTNPKVNFSKQVELRNRELFRKQMTKEENDLKDKEAKKWTYSFSSDVGVQDEKYPIVVIRSGFKVIKLTEDTALVGWIYEVINTSKKSAYTVDVSYSLLDFDGFKIGVGNGTGLVAPEDFGIIRGTITIPKSDLSRLQRDPFLIPASNWSVGLKPSWQSTEDKVNATRYERLSEIIARGDFLYRNFNTMFLFSSTKDDFKAKGTEKWIAIKKGVIKFKAKEEKDKSTK